MIVNTKAEKNNLLKLYCETCKIGIIRNAKLFQTKSDQTLPENIKFLLLHIDTSMHLIVPRTCRQWFHQSTGTEIQLEPNWHIYQPSTNVQTFLQSVS